MAGHYTTILRALQAEAKAKGMSEEAVYLEALIETKSNEAFKSRGVAKNANEQAAPSVIAVRPQTDSQTRTPQSPVIFDSYGIYNKAAQIKTNGACRLELWGSFAPADPNYIGYQHWHRLESGQKVISWTDPGTDQQNPWTFSPQQDPLTKPHPDAEWKYLGVLAYGGDRRTTWVSEQTMDAVKQFRWVQFDFIEGATPEITMYSYGT